jgi:hypothetical protein
MTTKPAEGTPNLTDEQFLELVKLMEGADTVELKLTVPEGERREHAQALGLDPLDAEIRQVFFFDTPDLALSEAGVVVRVRRVARKGDDSVVKLRPVVPEKLPDALRRNPSFGVEVDAMPGGFMCSGSMKGKVTKPGVREHLEQGLPVRKLFTKDQRALYKAHAPEGIAMDDLSVLGPVFVLKLRFWPKELDQKMVAELWLYPDNSRVIELSTKCVPSDAFQVAAGTRAYLLEHGIDLDAEQEAKTKRALEFFTSDLS